jgi:hypothetical protein
MPRVAVIQDGTELARQTDADITGCFERCCEILSGDGTTFEVQIFTDEAASFLLDGINRDEYASLVFASNALNSGQIDQAVQRHRPQLRRYLDSGGGLVVLHQLRESLTSVLPEDTCPDMVDRVSVRGADRTTAYDADDVLLHYPAAVPIERFVDGGSAMGPPSLFYKALRAKSLPDKLKPVLRYGDELLVARTYDHVKERVVVAALPLDWQRAVELLANALRFACLGLPRRLVWHDGDPNRRRLLLHWLSLDGASSIRPMPDDRATLDPTQAWLLSHVDVLLLPPARLESAQIRDEVTRFVAYGGTLIAADDVSQAAGSRITAVVGGYTERRLARRLYGELRAVRGWEAVDYAFALRNIVTALAFLWTNPANHSEAAVSTEELVALVPALRERLCDERHREDLSSSIAHVQSLALLSPNPIEPELLEWMGRDPRVLRFDVGLQFRAITALALRRPDPGLAAEALRALREHGDDVSLAAVVRILDAIGILDQAGAIDCEPQILRELADRVCVQLERHPPVPDVGWLSVEATADVTRGLVAFLSHLPRDDANLTARVLDRLGTAVVVLKHALRHYEEDRKAVARLARLTHAIALVDRHYPIGLQRLASLDWPDSSVDAAAAGGERSLLDRLAAENRSLRARDQELREARLAGQIGRGAATLGVTALVAAPFAYLLAAIGFDSIWTLLGNITVIVTMLLGIVAGAFTMLTRWHLLAGPAVRIREWIGHVVPVLKSLSELKRK